MIRREHSEGSAPAPAPARHRVLTRPGWPARRQDDGWSAETAFSDS